MQKIVHEGKLRSPLEKGPVPISFNLIGYRNDLFTSNNPDDIIEFYNTFRDRASLIKWMKERPKGVSYIHEVEGRKDIIVVIPIADFNGRYARTCREEIFKGLHMIFIESGVGNFYFNYAHNCNVGIKKALKYDPKWIIVSNDDMYKIDDISVLINQLENIDNNKYMSVFTKPSRYHSFNTYVGKKRFLLRDITALIYYLKERRLLNWRIAHKIVTKQNYDLKWGPGLRNKVLGKLLSSNTYFYTMTSSFTILSSKFCKNKIEVFNETYQNGVEDWELSIELSKFERTIIDYKIGDIIGGTLGNDLKREIRDLVNNVYFNERIQVLLQNKNNMMRDPTET